MYPARREKPDFVQGQVCSPGDLVRHALAGHIEVAALVFGARAPAATYSPSDSRFVAMILAPAADTITLM